MDQEIEKTIHYVKRELMGLDGSHDWFHVERVWRNSIRIGKEEGGDMDVIQLAALLHDIADWKYHGETSKRVRKRHGVGWSDFRRIQRSSITSVKSFKICLLRGPISLPP